MITHQSKKSETKSEPTIPIRLSNSLDNFWKTFPVGCSKLNRGPDKNDDVITVLRESWISMVEHDNNATSKRGEQIDFSFSPQKHTNGVMILISQTMKVS